MSSRALIKKFTYLWYEKVLPWSLATLSTISGFQCSSYQSSHVKLMQRNEKKARFNQPRVRSNSNNVYVVDLLPERQCLKPPKHPIVVQP